MAVTAAPVAHNDHLIRLLCGLTDDGAVRRSGVGARGSRQRESSSDEHRKNNRTHRFFLLGSFYPREKITDFR
jgi:hypothetical protein